MDHPQGIMRTGDRATVTFEFISHPEFLKEGMKLLFREGKTKVSEILMRSHRDVLNDADIALLGSRRCDQATVIDIRFRNHRVACSVPVLFFAFSGFLSLILIMYVRLCVFM